MVECKKRIGIARAIAMNQNMLFCDEPNSGLDPKTAIKIDSLIKNLRMNSIQPQIVITHDMNSVMEIGDNILFINEGKKWWEGSKSSIVTTKNRRSIRFCIRIWIYEGNKK